jgi:hypothetical protein
MPSAANITMTLPMVPLREHTQTDRTLASPSLYRISSETDARLTASAITPMPSTTSALESVDER